MEEGFESTALFLLTAPVGLLCPVSGLSLRLNDLEVVRFGQIYTPHYKQHWNTGTKPEQASPAVGGGWYQRSVEYRCEEVTNCVSLLEDARCNSSSVVRKVFQCRGSSRSKESLKKPSIPRLALRVIQVTHAHADPVKRSHSQERRKGMTET